MRDKVKLLVSAISPHLRWLLLLLSLVALLLGIGAPDGVGNGGW